MRKNYYIRHSDLKGGGYIVYYILANGNASEGQWFATRKEANDYVNAITAPLNEDIYEESDN